ncbi:MAG: PD-(D/E)XK nuclease family protein [Verrucomicrobiota bacterium]
MFERLSWQYAFPAAARQPAKVSVSTLRRQAEEALQDDEAQAWTKPSIIKREPAAGRASAVEIGLAHHRFLQHVRLDRVSSVAELRREAGRLQAENILSPAECAGLDFDAMAAFWNSEPGRGFAERRGEVRRELAFTARFSAAELAACTGRQPAADLAGESILVQGVVDLACILPDEIRVLDFKTDRVQEAELESRTAHYRPQLELYARALERIYGRPVRQRSLYFLAVRRAVAL